MRALIIVFLLLFQDLFIYFIGGGYWVFLVIFTVVCCLIRTQEIRIKKTSLFIFYIFFLIFFFRAFFLGIPPKSILNELLIYLFLPLSFFILHKIPSNRHQRFYFYFFLILVVGIITEFFTGVFNEFQRNAPHRNFFLIGSPSNLFIYSFGLILLSKNVFSQKIKLTFNVIISYLSLSRFPFLASIFVFIPKLKSKLLIYFIYVCSAGTIYLFSNQILLDPGNIGRIKYWIYLFNGYDPDLYEFFLGKGFGFISQNPIYESVHMESSFIKTFIELGVLGIALFTYIYYKLIKHTTDVYYRLYISLIFIQAIIAPIFPSIGNFIFLGLTSSLYKKRSDYSFRITSKNK